ncbi:hypothetical protein [Gryllotalpicola sp.]|uniref:hypothetical protein n=1 Tax=Gryllotalpicola sp. TaxID=1932787 RepID=UPI0026030881|nr:hypothetical protein [Gryllotalpicola sp.]
MTADTPILRFVQLSDRDWIALDARLHVRYILHRMTRIVNRETLVQWCMRLGAVDPANRTVLGWFDDLTQVKAMCEEHAAGVDRDAAHPRGGSPWPGRIGRT